MSEALFPYSSTFRLNLAFDTLFEPITPNSPSRTVEIGLWTLEQPWHGPAPATNSLGYRLTGFIEETVDLRL